MNRSLKMRRRVEYNISQQEQGGSGIRAGMVHTLGRAIFTDARKWHENYLASVSAYVGGYRADVEITVRRGECDSSGRGTGNAKEIMFCTNREGLDRLIDCLVATREAVRSSDRRFYQEHLQEMTDHEKDFLGEMQSGCDQDLLSRSCSKPTKSPTNEYGGLTKKQWVMSQAYGNKASTKHPELDSNQRPAD